MKTKREIALEQIEIQEEIQKAGYNIVTCGHCGDVILHRMGQETLECLCGVEMDLSDCPDLWYSGLENNEEFNQE